MSVLSQCTSCDAVFTVLPHFVLRYRRMSPDLVRQALIATHGGLSLEGCAVVFNISPMALYRLVCALGQHSLVAVLVKCRLPLPAYILADEKHGRGLTDRVYLPTIVSGRVIWPLGYSDSKSAAAFTASYGQFQLKFCNLPRCHYGRIKTALIRGTAPGSSLKMSTIQSTRRSSNSDFTAR
jgi:hypothetical protein